VRYFVRTLHYLKPYWKLAVVSVVLIALGSAAGLLAPWPLKILFDYVLYNLPMKGVIGHLLGPLGLSRTGLLVFAVVGGVVVVLVQHGLGVLDNYVNTKIDQGMVLDFRSDLFRHAQRLSLAFHDQRQSGMVIYAINSQADAAARLVMVIPGLAQSVLSLVGMFWILVAMDLEIAILSLVVVPFLYYSVGYYVKHIKARLYEVREMEGGLLSIIHESLSMLRVIVAFCREGHEERRYRALGEKAVDARVRVTVRQTLFSLAVDTITASGTALVLGVGAWHALEGKIQPGDLLIVMSYVALVYKPLETISSTVGSLQDVLVSLKVSFDLLDIVPDIQDAPDARQIRRAAGHVRYENVSFTYAGREDTLTDISFAAKPGQVIAIVGPTGAGKSTLVSLLPRFYDVKAGRVLLDGQDTRGLTLQSLREQVSIVLQEPLLFSGTIAENIRYGRLDATDEAVMEAARAANAHDFIVKLPKGYETELGERGAKLSGGERQRIAVARAFLKDAPILILDEPTSSIDSRTEAVILDALDLLMVGRTTFMIAHRLSTVRRADLILVLDHGRLVESGTHQDLLEKGGLYRQLYDLQNRPRGRKLLEEMVAARANGGRT
jgi:ATP-binding cassette subfamily B protein/subfamily B ATP-binding cassette protein MsbA